MTTKKSFLSKISLRKLYTMPSPTIYMVNPITAQLYFINRLSHLLLKKNHTIFSTAAQIITTAKFNAQSINITDI